MSLKADTSSPVFFATLQALDSEIRQPALAQSRVLRFEKASDKSKRNYDPMAHMIRDLLANTVFFAKDSAGDLYGVYTATDKEFIVKFDHQDVFMIIGDSISNWVREVYFNTSEYDVSAFEAACQSQFGVGYQAPDERGFPNIYLPYFPA
jgi:hypothetical protein